MVLQDWLKLKNGTDVRGVALEGIEGEHVNLTDDVLTTIAKAFTVWLAQKTGKKNPTIAVGHDSRLSAKRVETCVANGVTEMGSDVILTGLSSTPSMFMLLQKEDFGADGSIEPHVRSDDESRKATCRSRTYTPRHATFPNRS